MGLVAFAALAFFERLMGRLLAVFLNRPMALAAGGIPGCEQELLAVAAMDCVTC